MIEELERKRERNKEERGTRKRERNKEEREEQRRKVQEIGNM